MGDAAYPDCLADHYDTDYDILRRDAADVDFYRDLAREAAGPVCEVACGTGRVLLPVARDGAICTGVDPTRRMLEVFAAKLDAEPVVAARTTLVEGTFAHTTLPDGGFALVYSAFRAFQHLVTPEARRAGLAELARITAPGGLIAFDTFDYDTRVQRQFDRDHVDYQLEVDGHVHERRSRARFDTDTRVLDVHFSWWEDGAEVAAGDFLMAAPTRDELVGHVEACGLELVDVFADFRRSPWTADDPREIVLLARRPCAP